LGRLFFIRALKNLVLKKLSFEATMINRFHDKLRQSLVVHPLPWTPKKILGSFLAAIVAAAAIGLIQVSLRYDSNDAERWWSYYFFNQLISWGHWIIWTPIVINLTTSISYSIKNEIKTYLLIALTVIVIALGAVSADGALWHIFFNNSPDWPWPRVWKATISNRYGFHFLFGLAIILCIAIRQLIYISKNRKEFSPLVRKKNGNFDGSLVIKHKGRTEFIPLGQISHLSASGSYVEIYTDKSKIVVTGTLKQYEAQLPEPDFIRIHRSYIVKVDCVQQLIPMTNEDHRLITNTGHELRVSRSYKKILPLLKGVAIAHG